LEAGLKFQLAKNSLFGILLRSPWWVSMLIAIVLGLVGAALLPERFRAVGAVSGFPFVVIAGISAWRRRHTPSAARIALTQQTTSAMAWLAFAALLEQAFRRDGFKVQPVKAEGADFELERKGRRMLVCARRWKSARVGLEPLRALQAAREAAEAPDALCIGLGTVSDNAAPFAAEHRIAIWQTAELAEALWGLPLGEG
jgi:restriction system protein